MICRKCGYMNQSDAVFCAGCGTKLAPPQRQFCPKCGAELPENAKFCDRCGTGKTGPQKKLPVKAIVCAAVAALIAVVGIAVGISSLGKEKPKPQPSVQVTEAPVRITETKPAPAPRQKNYMEQDFIWVENKVFGLSVARDQIRKVVFLDTLKSAPGNAHDLSKKKDKSVMTWMDGNNVLHIAADGPIVAPESIWGLFHGFTALEEVSFNGCFDTSGVKSMGFVFSDCTSLRKLDLSDFDTRNVTDMAYMFSGCHSLPSLDISGFDTSAVTDMQGMFNSCLALKTLDLRNFDTRKVTSMSWMFYNCSELESLDLRGFSFRNVEDASYLFNRCRKLMKVNVGSIDLPANADTTLMFEYCPAFQETEPAPTAPPATTAPAASAYEPSGHRSEVQISVGGTVSYPWIFDEPVTDCTGFTLHYQITRINYGKVEGTYVVYRKTMAGTWERVGKFDVKGQEEVTATFEFSQPISFTELAIAAPSGRNFSFSSRNWYDNWQFRN